MGVELSGLQDLEDRTARATDRLLRIDTELAAKLEDATPPTVVFDSPTMRPRPWGAELPWVLPQGSWLAPRVQLPENPDILTDYFAHLFD